MTDGQSHSAGDAGTVTAADALSRASELLARRYAGAAFAIAAGTIVRGESTSPRSDLDLVVLYPRLACARRESFCCRAMPVEAFVHDPETIQAFIDRDHRDGHPHLIHMVASGTVVGAATATARRLQDHARALLNDGPQPATEEQLQVLRYGASELIEDLRDDRPPHEVRTILYRLHAVLAELRLKQARRWVGTGKHLARALTTLDPRFAQTLDAVMVAGHLGRLEGAQIARLDGLLDTLGGPLFEGYQSDAPPDLRTTARWEQETASRPSPPPGGADEPSGEALIAAMQATPFPDIDIEPKRDRMPVREVDL